MLIAVTELRTKEEIDALIQELGIAMSNQDQALILSFPERPYRLQSAGARCTGNRIGEPLVRHLYS